MPTHLVSIQANNLATILFDEKTIKERVQTLGREISALYEGRELTIIAIANGAIIFTADLIRSLTLATRLDCIHASSYRDSAQPVKAPEIMNRIHLDIKDKDVLLIDDILDTGRTLLKVSETLLSMHPKSLKTCILLDKKARRSVNCTADFIGFEIPNEFVVGYGLDFAESYRQLPCIGILKKEVYSVGIS